MRSRTSTLGSATKTYRGLDVKKRFDSAELLDCCAEVTERTGQHPGLSAASARRERLKLDAEHAGRLFPRETADSQLRAHARDARTALPKARLQRRGNRRTFSKQRTGLRLRRHRGRVIRRRRARRGLVLRGIDLLRRAHFLLGIACEFRDVEPGRGRGSAVNVAGASASGHHQATPFTSVATSAAVTMRGPECERKSLTNASHRKSCPRMRAPTSS